MISNSKEIRWFNRKKETQIIKWFEEKNLSFATSKKRIDFYFPIGDKSDLSIKVREGNIEIKQRKGTPILHELTNYSIGFFENWTKYGFDIVAEDKLMKVIVDGKADDWLEIHKERIGLKYGIDEFGLPKFYNLKEKIDYGGQIEYTRLLINGKEWYTFALESFGNKEVNLEKEELMKILTGVTFSKEDSYGYPTFIYNILNL